MVEDVIYCRTPVSLWRQWGRGGEEGPGSRMGDRKVPEPVLLTRCTAPRPKSHPPTTIKEAGFWGIRIQTSILRVIELVGA